MSALPAKSPFRGFAKGSAYFDVWRTKISLAQIARLQTCACGKRCKSEQCGRCRWAAKQRATVQQRRTA